MAVSKATLHFIERLEVAPASGADAFERAVDAWRRGDSAAAMSALFEFLDANPDSPEGLNNLGVLMAENAHLVSAIDLFESALEVSPELSAAS